MLKHFLHSTQYLLIKLYFTINHNYSPLFFYSPSADIIGRVAPEAKTHHNKIAVIGIVLRFIYMYIEVMKIKL